MQFQDSVIPLKVIVNGHGQHIISNDTVDAVNANDMHAHQSNLHTFRFVKYHSFK